ncbi:MAG: Hsp20/alpha crystallin family protein [Candidatus Omnitrophota bacterium]|nr:Hsp20/alpha crystallin family protein [Candidatus Omnitrophota bacterium]
MTRRILVIVAATFLLADLGFSETAPTDTTAQDLSTLRKKLGRVKREMDLLIKDMVSGAPTASDAVLKGYSGDVSVDILQNERSVTVKADLPGMEKDKINITLESGRFLNISGSREMTKSQTAPGVVKQERFFGSFEKTVELPCEVENSGISATYKDGVLEVTIPKKAQTKENKVKITVS